MSDAPDFQAVLERLQERSLLTRGARRITNHAIVSLALHHQPEPEEAQHTRHSKHAQAIASLFLQAQEADHHDRQDLLYPDLKLALKRAVFLVEHQGIVGAEIAFDLATAICNHPRGELVDNLELAIEAYRTALTVRTRERVPRDWAKTQNNLGVALAKLPTGDRAGNIQQAINAYRAALTVRTRENLPGQWARTQNNLGVALADLPTGDRAHNLRQAIACYQAALEVFQQERFPADHERTSGHLERARDALEALEKRLPATPLLPDG
jgi:tetratricopeptide (TPR) repeat protein